jgi:thioredoxin-like negative regulator of GroEL
MTLAATGRAAEALPSLEAMVDTTLAELGESSPRTAEARLGLGMALLALGRASDAAPLLRSAASALEPMRATQPVLYRLAATTLRGAGLSDSASASPSTAHRSR